MVIGWYTNRRQAHYFLEDGFMEIIETVGAMSYILVAAIVLLRIFGKNFESMEDELC